MCCPGTKLQPRPWWGATLHDPGDVQQWLAKRSATDEQPAWAAPVSEIIRDRTRFAALQPVMTDFRKVSNLQTERKTRSSHMPRIVTMLRCQHRICFIYVVAWPTPGSRG